MEAALVWIGAPPDRWLDPQAVRARFSLGAPPSAEPLAFELWPEAEPAVDVFVALLTQWQLGPAGLPAGLRYEVLPVVLRLTEVPRPQWPAVFDALQVMEAAALAYWRERALRTRPANRLH